MPKTSLYKRVVWFCVLQVTVSPFFVICSLLVQYRTSRHPDTDWKHPGKQNQMQGSLEFGIIYAAHPVGSQPNSTGGNLLHILSRLATQWMLLERNPNCNCAKRFWERKNKSPVWFYVFQNVCKVHHQNASRVSGKGSKALSTDCGSH